MRKFLHIAVGFFAFFAFAAQATMWARVSGVWQQITDPQVNVSGTYHAVQEGWVKVSGVWQQFYTRAVYDLPGSVADTNFGGGSAQATITLVTGGTFTSAGINVGTVDSGNWVTPTTLAPGSYTIRAHLNSGDTPAGSALDSDLALTSNRSWNVSVPSSGSSTAVLALTLKDGGGNTVATATTTITAFSM